MARFETAFLDAGGVLLHPNWLRVAAALERRGVAVAPERLALGDPGARRSLDDPGTVSRTSDASRWDLYFDLVLGSAGIPPSPATKAALRDLKEEHDRKNLWDRVPEDVVPFLEGLRRGGLRIVVVSNSNGTLRALLADLGLLDRVDLVVDSAEEGVEKPDPEIFRRALERSGARREETAHMGDLYSVDVQGAEKAGIAALLYDPQSLYPGVPCPRARSLAEATAFFLAEAESRAPDAFRS
jgi:HAD superfamily hydrolase (TIGR01549 family)